MNKEELYSLERGDIVSDSNDNRYIVTANYGGRVTAVKTVDITNPIEWNVILKSSYKEKEIEYQTLKQ